GGGGWSDEGDAGVVAGCRKRGILCKKSVPRVNRIRAAALGRVDNFLDGQVTLPRRSGTDRVCFVSHSYVKCATIRFRIYGNRADSQFPTRTNNADRNFTSVRDQDLLKHFSNTYTTRASDVNS